MPFFCTIKLGDIMALFKKEGLRKITRFGKTKELFERALTLYNKGNYEDACTYFNDN